MKVKNEYHFLRRFFENFEKAFDGAFRFCCKKVRISLIIGIDSSMSFFLLIFPFLKEYQRRKTALIRWRNTVCFERIINLIKLLKTAEIQRTSGFRINRILRSDLVIIDEIGYTPIVRREANLFFNMISELYEKSSIITTSNKSFDTWAEMMGDEVLTTALLDRLLHHARVFNLDGESYRLREIDQNNNYYPLSIFPVSAQINSPFFAHLITPP